MLSTRSNSAPCTLDDAERYLDGKDQRKIMNNTYLVRDVLVGGVSVVLHHTAIVRFGADGRIMLNSGGWQSVTTKRRMNAFLPWSVGVVQDKGQWYVWRRTDDSRIPFADGMVIEP